MIIYNIVDKLILPIIPLILYTILIEYILNFVMYNIIIDKCYCSYSETVENESCSYWNVAIYTRQKIIVNRGPHSREKLIFHHRG